MANPNPNHGRVRTHAAVAQQRPMQRLAGARDERRWDLASRDHDAREAQRAAQLDLQPYVRWAATTCQQGCNRMSARLGKAANTCQRGCNRMSARLQP